MTNIDRINELVGNKNFEEAKPLLAEALAQDENNIELLKLAGLTEVNLGNWKDAIKHFETVVKFNAEDATSWFYLASSYEKTEDLISAKNAYIKVIELRNEYMEAYKNLSILLLKLQDYENVIKYCLQAGGIDKEEYLYDFLAATAYMKNREFAKATEPLKIALSKSPNNLSILNSLGTCYMAQGMAGEAISTYEQALKIDDRNTMAYYNIGSAYQILQKHDIACEYLRKAVELEEDESFLTALAMSEVKIGDYENALTHYKQLQLMCPSKENYKYNIVTCYEALGDYKTAINMLEGMLYINPKFLLPAQKLASLYLKTNQLAKAKEIYDNILLKNKVTAETLHQYAILSSTLCDTDTAERMLKKVIKMNPEMAKAHKDLGIIFLNKRLFDYAEDEFQTALRLSPNDFEILFEYGNFLYSISKNNEAERYYTEALEIEPKNVMALTFMALNKLILNQLDESKNYIMKALETHPNHEYVQFCAGRILYARKEFDDAKRYLIRSVEQNQDVETQNTLALTYFELGEYTNALNIFKNIETKNPQNISVMMEIARCYEALQENDNALKYLDKIVDIFPEHEDAHEMIRKLS